MSSPLSNLLPTSGTILGRGGKFFKLTGDGTSIIPAGAPGFERFGEGGFNLWKDTVYTTVNPSVAVSGNECFDGLTFIAGAGLYLQPKVNGPTLNTRLTTPNMASFGSDFVNVFFDNPWSYSYPQDATHTIGFFRFRSSLYSQGTGHRRWAHTLRIANCVSDSYNRVICLWTTGVDGGDPYGAHGYALVINGGKVRLVYWIYGGAANDYKFVVYSTGTDLCDYSTDLNIVLTPVSQTQMMVYCNGVGALSPIPPTTGNSSATYRWLNWGFTLGIPWVLQDYTTGSKPTRSALGTILSWKHYIDVNALPEATSPTTTTHELATYVKESGGASEEGMWYKFIPTEVAGEPSFVYTDQDSHNVRRLIHNGARKIEYPVKTSKFAIGSYSLKSYPNNSYALVLVPTSGTLYSQVEDEPFYTVRGGTFAQAGEGSVTCELKSFKYGDRGMRLGTPEDMGVMKFSFAPSDYAAGGGVRPGAFNLVFDVTLEGTGTGIIKFIELQHEWGSFEVWVNLATKKGYVLYDGVASPEFPINNGENILAYVERLDLPSEGDLNASIVVNGATIATRAGIERLPGNGLNGSVRVTLANYMKLSKFLVVPVPPLIRNSTQLD